MEHGIVLKQLDLVAVVKLNRMLEASTLRPASEPPAATRAHPR
jgi:hypothetical protein